MGQESVYSSKDALQWTVNYHKNSGIRKGDIWNQNWKPEHNNLKYKISTWLTESNEHLDIIIKVNVEIWNHIKGKIKRNVNQQVSDFITVVDKVLDSFNFLDSRIDRWTVCWKPRQGP